jgi:hypothetical protein
MSCTEFDENDILLFAYGELEAEESERLSAHLSECAECRRALDEIEGVRRMFKDAALQVSPSPASLNRIMNSARSRARRQRFRKAFALPGIVPFPRLAWTAAALVLAVAIFIFMAWQNERYKELAYEMETVEDMMEELSEVEGSILAGYEGYDTKAQNLVAYLDNIDQELSYLGINGGSYEGSDTWREDWQELEKDLEQMDEYLEIYQEVKE